jgi:enoyl-[acyl-carrier protein] reductase I
MLLLRCESRDMPPALALSSRGVPPSLQYPGFSTMTDVASPIQAQAPQAAPYEPALPAKGTLLAGKRGLVMGVANDRSIAWGIAAAAAAQGAELAFTYQGEALQKRVEPLAESVGSRLVVPCDVTDDASVDATFAAIASAWGGLDFLVHAIAWSDKEQLKGSYLDTTRENFLRTLDISCFSFTSVAQRAVPLMRPGGSLLTLTYLGAERVTPHYNVMGVAKAALEASVRYLATDLGPRGIRVNAISAGPIKTLAASGIGDFRYILKWNQYNAPLKRNVTTDEVGGSGVYLLSDLAAGVTGEVHHVDCGYHVVGMKAVDAPDIATV